MFTSLLKVVSLSIICSISPFNDGTSSSFLSVGEVPSTQRAIISPSISNSYTSYDDDDGYLKKVVMRSTDLSAFYNHFVFGDIDYSFQPSVVCSYKINVRDYEVLYSVSRVVYNSSDKYLFLYSGSNYIEIGDTGNNYFRIRLGNSASDLFSLTFYVTNSSSDDWVEFVEEMNRSFAFGNNPIAITSQQANTIRFSHLASYLNSVGYQSSYIYLQTDIQELSFSARGDYYADSCIVWVDEDSVTFGFGGNYLNGVFYTNSNVFGFSDSLNFYISTSELRDGFISALNLDIQGESYFDNDYVNSFTFDFNFNYNAPYSSAINNVFVNDSYFTNVYSDSPHKIVSIPLPSFESNGQIFNKIELWYFNAIGITYYNDNTDSYITNRSGGFGYFSMMFYVNDINQSSKFVYNRLFGEYTDSSDNVQVYLTNSGTWVNDDYRYLDFYMGLTPTQKDNLSQFNNASFVNSIVVGDSTGAFSRVFSLIDTAFMGLLGLLNYQVFPGVSIGVLVIVPFVLTILLFVVKLFKR